MQRQRIFITVQNSPVNSKSAVQQRTEGSIMALNLSRAGDPLLRSQFFLRFGDTVFQPPGFYVVLTAISQHA